MIQNPSSSQKWWVLLAVGTGTFMTALDGSVVNTILPVIQKDFARDIASIEWIIIIYLLVVSGLLPIFGRLGDLRGHKQVYMLGFVLFISSSILCAYSNSINFLVASRAIQALGAAMLSANSPAILTKSFPDNQRGQALGMQATMTYLGLSVGPVLGGWLTDQFNWHTVFMINLPVGLIALIFSALFITKDKPEFDSERFDFLGAVLFFLGLISLLLGLNQGHEWQWLSFPTLATILSSIILFRLFFNVEKKCIAPMLDINLFHNRLFTLSTITAILNYMCVNSSIFLMPFYLIQGRGLSPSQAGLILIAQPITMAIIAPISGTISDRIGSRIPTTFGMCLIAVGLYLLSTLESSTPFQFIILSLLILGLGIGIFISPNNSALMGSSPSHRQGIAAGLLATARNVGMVLGVGLSGAIFNTYYHPAISPTDQSLYPALQNSFLVACTVALIGVILSSIRSDTNTLNK
jgi:EmrB/QacA subfamily drug resistance transporter